MSQLLPSAGRPPFHARPGLSCRGVSLAAAAALLAGALSFPAAAERVLRIGNGPPSETLDPHRAIGIPDARIIQELFEGLVALDASGEVGPAAAESWATSADGLTWTFTLRADGKWSDGTPVVAEDFAHGLRRALDPATRAADPRDLYAILNAEEVATGKKKPAELGVRAVADRTLEIRLNRPSPDLLIQLADRSCYPVNRASLAKHGDGFARAGNLVGNGPFLLAENVPQSHVKLTRNPQWRAAGSVRLDALVFYQTEDAATALKRFRGGELDISYTSPITQVQWMRENLGPALRIAPTQRTFYLTPNFSKEPWKSNAALRQALSMALDRDILAAKVSRGVDSPAYSMVPPGTGGYQPARPGWAGWTQAQRDAQAKALLAQADFGPGGKSLEVELLYATDEIRKQVSVAVAAMWQKTLGVKVTLVNQEARVVWDRLRDRSFGGLVYDSWVDNLPVRFLDIMLSSEAQNNGGYDNPAYDAALGAAMATADRAQYHEKLRAAERLLLDEAAVIPVLFGGGRVLVADRVKGWQDSPTQMTPLRGLWVGE